MIFAPLEHHISDMCQYRRYLLGHCLDQRYRNVVKAAGPSISVIIMLKTSAGSVFSSTRLLVGLPQPTPTLSTLLCPHLPLLTKYAFSSFKMSLLVLSLVEISFKTETFLGLFPVYVSISFQVALYLLLELDLDIPTVIHLLCHLNNSSQNLTVSVIIFAPDSSQVHLHLTFTGNFYAICDP
ncbi:hypothetical protein HHI36_014904 [Cryptolaemus montrouzieri]|uniref:Uncharacterized protein n=1 Tax=Cryptolaemus montrouzieri TaxID=559131 RepID=A0ABD2N455_9CUCU